MAGYWPSSFFACSWTEIESRSMNSQIKKNKSYQYPAISVQKRIYYMAFEEIFVRDTAGSPERVR